MIRAVTAVLLLYYKSSLLVLARCLAGLIFFFFFALAVFCLHAAFFYACNCVSFVVLTALFYVMYCVFLIVVGVSRRCGWFLPQLCRAVVRWGHLRHHLCRGEHRQQRECLLVTRARYSRTRVVTRSILVYLTNTPREKKKQIRRASKSLELVSQLLPV